MSLESMYGALGENLADVRARLQSDARIEKYVKIFLADSTYAQLVESMAEGDLQTAFRAAHTLKGTSRDIGLMSIHAPAFKLADALRPGPDGVPADPDAAPALAEEVTEAYTKLVEASREHLQG